MFTTFSGNSRRPRQVNLSGRTSNPFAAVQASGGAGNPPGGGNAAIAHAQLERRARQQERDRLNAAKSLQRVWRGHKSRRELREEYRAALLKSEEILKATPSEQRTLQDVWQHLRFCVQGLRPSSKNDVDIRRLLIVGTWMHSLRDEIVAAWRQTGREQGQASAPLRSYVMLLLQYLDVALPSRQQASQAHGTSHTALVHETFLILSLALRIANSVVPGYADRSLSSPSFSKPQTPANKVLVVEQYYRILGRLDHLGRLPSSMDAAVAKQEVVISEPLMWSLLSAPGGLLEDSELVYKALTVGLLNSNLSEELLTCCRQVVNLVYLLEIARGLLEDGGMHRHNAQAPSQPALLANIIFICNEKEEPSGQDKSVIPRHRQSFSTNPSFLAILCRALQDCNTVNDLDAMTAKQLKRLVTKENINALISNTQWESVDEKHTHDSWILADYLLTVMRLLPSQADYVRMWVYRSHNISSGPAQEDRSAIRLFWTKVSTSQIFRRASARSRDAAAVLPDQITANSAAESERLRDWKIILLFLELYSFALRLQDDEQLVAGLNAEAAGGKPQTSTITLGEMRMLVTFLKNTSYVLYTERNVPIFDTSESSSTANDARTGTEVVNNSFRPVRNVSMSQLKGATTGLLRLIYERDSRRKFLPAHHFILEDFESAQFIADVFREQELRTAIEQGSGDESDDDVQMEDSEYARPEDDGVMQSSHTIQLRRQTERMERYRKRAQKSAWQKAAPRVEMLENIPFLIPFETRVRIFRSEVRMDMVQRRSGILDPDEWRLRMAPEMMMRGSAGAHFAELDRSNIFEGAFEAFYKLGDGIKEPIKIAFRGEEGIDGGGVTKEFLTSIIDEVFSSRHVLFAENDQHEMYPDPSSLDETKLKHPGERKLGEIELRSRRRLRLQAYEFVGRIVGKCLYEGILVHIPLARFFIAKWALTGGDGSARHDSTFRVSINDLWDYDQAIYRSMLQVKNYTGEVRDMGLDFSVTHEVSPGVRRDFELKPGGSRIAVENSNRLVYIQAMTKHYLVERQREQTRAFLDGLSSVIKPTWLRMFNETEVRVLLGGESKPIDVENLRRWTIYGGVYQIGDDGQEHPTIKMFWEVMHEMEDSDRRKLLQYATSTPNAPLMGFEYLHPRFSIRDSASDQGRLPTSSTCANLLKLPIYKTKEVLRAKMLTAIHSGAGFDLS